MSDPITEALEDLLPDHWYPDVFEKQLAEYGLMIVPIDDPTSLRYGVTIDDLAD